MKKIKEFIKKDWKNTRGMFCVLVSYTGMMLSFIIVNIIALGKSEVAVWQVMFLVIYLFLIRTQKDVRYWQESTFEVLEEWSQSVNKLTGIVSIIDFAEKAKSKGEEYLLVNNTKSGENGILCLNCRKTSYHPDDIKNLYCAECKKFHKKSNE